MDAHTLNAWTRFALQKGGIGTCTALVDNPATDAEDLMFMTGEKIIVLRRLDQDSAGAAESSAMSASSSSSSRRKSQNDGDAWFLGYCEGVVGKFKGAHVQIHGKLKKPVLMRRSHQAPIQEASTKLMSQAAAASLPESQVPVGIPVSTIESEDSEIGHAKSGKGSADSSAGNRVNGMTASVPPASSSSAPPPRAPPATQPTAPSYRRPSARDSSDSDSDESETMLPWARPAVEDDADPRKLGPGAAAAASSSSASRSDGPNELVRTALMQTQISPVESRNSSNESGAKSFGSHIPQSPSVESHMTSGTEDSEDDDANSSRRDHTLSIYDIYGRDSVAFPNFNFRGLPHSDTAASLKVESDKHPTPPMAPEHIRARVGAAAAPNNDVAAKLRSSPSGRRPNAAPDPRVAPPPPQAARALASSLRQQVEATSPRTEAPPQFPPNPHAHSAAPNGRQAAASAPNTPALAQHQDGPSRSNPNSMHGAPHGAPTFDPRRRPSGLQNGPPPGPPQQPQQRQQPPPLRIPQRSNTGSLTSPPSGVTNSATSPMAPPQGIPRPGQAIPAGFGPGSFISAAARGDRGSGSSSPGSVASAPADATSPYGSAASPTGSYFPPSVMASVGPKRASSDRTSQRERVGSGQLRKNPSNPSPGSYGGGQMPTGSVRGSSGVDILSPPPSSALGASRSPSPLGPTPPGNTSSRQPSPHFDTARAHSPSGSMASSSGPRSAPPQSVRPLAYDAKGFVLGSGVPCRPEIEDHETVKKWQAILAENDLVGARKNRKVRKLVQAGIPNSMRGQVWLFLCNASVRRRPGLFEGLCVTSQAPKGRKGREALYETIEKDVARCYPDNRLFQEGASGKADLEAILKAYVHYNPIIGYTQGMGLIAGMFLLHLPAEDAFWLLCALLRDIHMEGYFSNEMKQLHIDGVILGQLIQTMDGELANKLADVGVEPINFSPSWFLPLFCRILPWPTLIRVWDVFFYEGPNWILQVSLAIIRIIRAPLMATRGITASEDVLRLLLHPPTQELTTENVLSCALTVKLKDGEMRKMSRSASKLVREAQGMRGRRASSTSGPAVNGAAAAAAAGGAAAGRSPSVPARR
ncbi:hypothetical protein BDZ90DRAFT_262276 [Jaminaea rosea]|uniref:Rab-GAP TBC domain-containing protein n=1 Tax=Jaminaea rosea TaxID=1569628 RepID=A0A316UK80_9BASI|nr:hypothetical protein BDZ90DRAFT_262276 [Jaminaea rosea]PWN25630.1 hypothetical protein BDZ90DRAFT_262276 [Jaminaea rosea]